MPSPRPSVRIAAMDKTLRCTVCTWRGAWAEAAAVRVQPSALPPALEEIQQAYEAKQVEEELSWLADSALHYVRLLERYVAD